MPRYMLDTNTASYIIKGEPRRVRDHLLRVSMASICISTITEAELLFGVAQKPEAKRLPEVVNEFLLHVEILPWDSEAAKTYAELRARCDREGTPLGAMDMLIAAHARAAAATLVTSDRSFYKLRPRVSLADWARPR